jgi:hypothetical protein
MKCRLTMRDESGFLGFYLDLELPALPPVGAVIRSEENDWLMYVTGYWFHADTGIIEIQCDDEYSYPMKEMTEQELIAEQRARGWLLDEDDSMLGQASGYRKDEPSP